MQKRGLTPSVIECDIKNGKTVPPSRGNTPMHSTPDIKVITNKFGDVITVYPR